MNEQRFRLRICYAKTGRLRYLSHLETMRCLERSIRRAGLPFLVSQGFSPHMRTSFGWALPVGVSSQCEYIDVLVGEFVEPDEVREMLSASMPPDMQAQDVRYVDSAARCLEEEFPYSVYVCEFVLEAPATDAGEAGRLASVLAADASMAAATAGSADAATGEAADVSEAGGDLLANVRTALDEVLNRGNMVVRRKKKDKVVEFEGLLVGTPDLALRQRSAACECPAVEMRLTTFTEGQGSLRPDLFCGEIVAASGGTLSVRSIERIMQSSDLPRVPLQR